MGLRMFGGLRLERDGQAVDLGRPRQRFVLAILAIEANRVVATDRLTDLLWGSDGEKERASLHAYISNLRRVLDPERSGTVLVRQAPGYRLALARTDVDVLRFEDLVDRGIADGDLTALRDAIALWHEPLPELAGEPVIVAATTRWRNLLGAAVESAADSLLRRGEPDAAVRLLEPHVTSFALRERMAILSALALYRTGRQADALRVIERTRREVGDVGLDVGTELVALERQILAHAPEIAPVEVTTQTDLFGRDDARAKLRAAATRLRERRGGVVTISGPSGIGKTALVEDVSAPLADEGFEVTWARCPEGPGAPPFWPLSRLGLLDDPSAATADPFSTAQQIIGAVARSEVRRVLVIDDLQWADSDTLRVLTQLAGELRRTSVLLVTTARPLTPDAPADLVACLGELARQRVADVALDALSEADVRAWLGPDRELAPEIHQRSGGNPFFVRALIELVNGGQLPRSVPMGVQAVVRRRVSQLPGRTQQVLRLASLLGSPVDAHALSAAIGASAGALREVVSPAVDADLLTVDAPSGELRFAHAIVGEALAAEVPAADQAEMHAMLARAIDRTRPDDAHASLVAFHAVRGAPAGTAGLAAAAAMRAARFSAVHAAFSDAARHWSTAADMIERADPSDARGLVEALVALAHAHERADEMADAREAVVRAIDLATGLGDWPSVGAAASALNHASIWPNQPYPFVDRDLVARLESTLALMPPDDSAARVLTLGALGTELMHTADGTRRDAVSAEAIQIARRIGDAALLVKALHARTFSLKAPEAVPERKAVAQEIVALAEAHHLGADVELLGELQVALADLALGEIPEVAARLPRCIALLDLPVGLALRSQVGFFRAFVELLRGRHGEAVARAGEVHELFRRTRPLEAEVFAFAQRLTIGHDLGELSEADLAAAASEHAIGFALAMQLYSAVILFDLGRRDEALARVPYRMGAVPDRPVDYVTVFVDVAAAHVAAERRDVASVPALLARLEPMAGRFANAGTGAGSLGLVDLAIARLHATAGHREAAGSWFAIAVDAHERAGTPSWLARSLLHQGVFLGADGVASLTRAAELADAYGLPIVAAQVDRARRQGIAKEPT